MEKMKYAVVIKPDGTVKMQEIGNGAADLSVLQSLVGGYIEVVSVANSDFFLVVNEEGKLQGLRVNPIATAVYGTVDVIVGTAVMLKDYVNDEGERDLSGMDRNTALYITKTLRHRLRR